MSPAIRRYIRSPLVLRVQQYLPPLSARTSESAATYDLADAPESFRKRVRIEGECWVLSGGRHEKGYAYYGHRATNDSYAHRFAYRFFVGPIPSGLTIDHLCRNRACANPAHLEAVTVRENVLRGVGVSAVNARKTHCIRGHEFTPENTRMNAKGRHCRECQRLYNVAYTARLREVGVRESSRAAKTLAPSSQTPASLSGVADARKADMTPSAAPLGDVTPLFNNDRPLQPSPDGSAARARWETV